MKIKQSKGITLIALIITIIILLILAGVTITMLTGDNGILKQATNARETNDKSEFEEQVKLAVMASRVNDTASINLETLDEDTNKMNIYNFAGNEWEWTLEKTTNYYSPCSFRGGYYSSDGSGLPASSRTDNNTLYITPGIGLRVSLY